MRRIASVRLITGLIVAALWLPLLCYFVSGAYGRFWFFMTGFYTVPLTLLVAAPLVVLFRHRLSLPLCLGFGLAIGFVGALAFFAMTNYLAAVHWAPLLVISGLVSSLLFWVVAVFRNGDLTIVGGVRDAP